MTKLYKKYSLLWAMVCCVCSSAFAKPDVFFTDQEAYLSHELGPNSIKFILTGPILDFNLTDKFFDAEKLRNYIENVHNFEDKALKNEFIDMLNMSFESKFTAQAFLSELRKVLDGYDSTTVAHGVVAYCNDAILLLLDAFYANETNGILSFLSADKAIT